MLLPVIGQYASDARGLQHGGWLLGCFFDESSGRRTHALEAKYWELLPGEESSHPMKQSSVAELTFILKGVTKAQLGLDLLTINSGSYIFIPPGIPNNLVAEVLEPLIAITIKAPSRPGSKQLVPHELTPHDSH